MHRICSPAFILALVILSGVVHASAQTRSQDSGQDITYTVSLTQPSAHLLEVEMRVKRSGTRSWPAEDTLIMPVWTPGSYLIREYARHVQDFAATDSAGQPLSWEKINKNSWRVKTRAAQDWKVTYRVYANDLTVRTNQFNSDHAFWNNAALLMYPDGDLNEPSTLVVKPAAGWKVATGLPPIAGASNTFHATNFDILYDSPVEVSDFKEIDFAVQGVPHRIVIDGHGNYDAQQLRDDVQKIVATEAALMGEIPYHDYTFIVHLRTAGGGGLEHLNSTALEFTRFGFQPDDNYHGVLATFAHEFFHLWNVKRIRPDALGPFDYAKENYTKMLWVAEGFTEYYSGLVLRRAGLESDKTYLENLAADIQSLQNTPGRLKMSAEEASFDAWIKLYRPDENSSNSQVSYYDKGEVLGLLLDLEIRKRSGGSKSLDDVMRYLYTDYYKKGRNYTPADFQKACELMAGSSLDQFFSRYVRGREELDYNAALAAAGLRLDTVGETNPPAAKPYLGVQLAQDGDRLTVRSVSTGSPAAQGGLYSKDQILAIDGMRASEDFLFARLAEKKPGDTVHLTVFRDDELRTVDITLGTRNPAPYRIIALAQPTDEQKRSYQAWLGAPFPTASSEN